MRPPAPCVNPIPSFICFDFSNFVYPVFPSLWRSSQEVRTGTVGISGAAMLCHAYMDVRTGCASHHVSLYCEWKNTNKTSKSILLAHSLPTSEVSRLHKVIMQFFRRRSCDSSNPTPYHRHTREVVDGDSESVSLPLDPSLAPCEPLHIYTLPILIQLFKYIVKSHVNGLTRSFIRCHTYNFFYDAYIVERRIRERKKKAQIYD